MKTQNDWENLGEWEDWIKATKKYGGTIEEYLRLLEAKHKSELADARLQEYWKGVAQGKSEATEFYKNSCADARREVYLEIEKKVMECKKDIIKYQNTTDILHKTITKHEKAWINSGFRLALESLNKLHKFVLLATLRKEELNGTNN